MSLVLTQTNTRVRKNAVPQYADLQEASVALTEHGAVNLHGRTLRERAEALISIAHPDFRAELRREFARIRHVTLE